MIEKGFLDGMKDAMPTALGYISIGLAFGVVAANAGLSAVEVLLSSLLVYGGSAQFAMCALFVAGADVVTIVITIFLVNLRNMLMTLHATTIFTETGFWDNMGIASLMTDESYGVLLGERVHNEHIAASWMHGNNVLSYAAWVSSTVVGCLLGNAIPNPGTFGLDFALVAMFIGLLIGQFDAMLKVEKGRKIVLILLVVGIGFLALSMLVSESLAVLLATLMGCAMGVWIDEHQ